MRPLDGITVVTLEHAIAAPFCTRQLADLGARVIKIERPQADIAAAMYAYTNILAALIERGKTGVGCRIDVSMLESTGEWMSYPLYYAFDGATPLPRLGAAHATIYPYGPFPTGDGKTVILGLQNEREWAAFCTDVLRTDVDTPAGAVPALYPPGLPNAYAPRMDPVPALGQHTDAILGELGCDAAAIGRLRAEGAI